MELPPIKNQKNLGKKYRDAAREAREAEAERKAAELAATRSGGERKTRPAEEAFRDWEKKELVKDPKLHRKFSSLKLAVAAEVGKYYRVLKKEDYRWDDKTFSGYCVVKDTNGILILNELGTKNVNTNEYWLCELSADAETKLSEHDWTCLLDPIVEKWLKDDNKPATRAEFKNWYVFENFVKALEEANDPWLQYSPVAEPKVGEYYGILSTQNKQSPGLLYSGYCVVIDDNGALFLIENGKRSVDSKDMNTTEWIVPGKDEWGKGSCDTAPIVMAWKELNSKPNREAFNQWATVQKEFAEHKKIYPTCWLHDTDYKDLVPVTELTVGNFYVKVSKTAFIIPYSGYCVVNDDQGAIFLSGKVVAREAEDVPPEIEKEESGFMKGNDYYLEYKKYNTEDDPRNLVQRIQRDQMPIVMAWKELNPKPNRKAFLEWAGDYLKPTPPSSKRSGGNRGRRRRRGYVEFRF